MRSLRSLVRRPLLGSACAALVAIPLGFVVTARAEGASGAPASPAAPAASPYHLAFEKYTLDNGLEVILHEDRRLPVVAVNLWYHVGPANEPKGRSGFAHLFEHLMFEGSKHAGREFDRLLEAAGATNSNGTTSWDRTNYFETVPREYLELALWLESDRMGFMLDTLTQERLDVQRDVVKNERRQRHENSPYGPSELALYDALFPEGHPYHGAIIGSMKDLSDASMADVRAFFDAFYAPSNATLTLAGDFDAARARQWIDRYFGSLRARPRPERTQGATPPLTKEIRITVPEPVQVTKLTLAWITPPAFTPEDTALDVTSQILAGGKATRLYRQLVVDEKLASEVSASVDSNELASVFTIDAMLAPGKKPEDVERAIDRVLSTLREDGPTEDELSRARRGIELSVRRSLESLDGRGGESGRAGTLQRLNHYLGDPGALPATMARLVAVSAADVKQAVAKQLPSSSRVVLITEPVAPNEKEAP